jgi:hypothetical protein
MTADARIKQIALIAIMLGWPIIALVYLFAGMSPILDWSILGLIGATIGLGSRWLTDRWGAN